MGIIETVIGLLIVFWVIGFILHIGGALIHLLLVLAVLALIARVLGLRV